MAEFSSPHAPGTFCWAELATTDQNAGIAFYRALLGWDVHQEPIGPDEVYSMFRMRGKEVAAAYNMRPEERQQGAPPHWNLYVAVASVDDTAKRAEGLGGKVLMPPFDVMDAGCMAVIQDPTGAVISLWWKDGAHTGSATDPMKEGAFCWSELMTDNIDKAQSFYTKLFPWKTKAEDTSYTEWQLDGQSIGGTVSGFVGSLVFCLWLVLGQGLPVTWIALAVMISFSNTLLELLSPRGTDDFFMATGNAVLCLAFGMLVSS